MVFFVKKERSGGGGRWEKYEVKSMKDEELSTKGTKGDGAEVRSQGARSLLTLYKKTI
jgi:hypothetical protein